MMEVRWWRDVDRSSERDLDLYPSLRKRLLALLFLPMLLVIVTLSTLFYVAALDYSNTVHDRDLGDQVLGLGRMLRLTKSDGVLLPEAQQLLEYNVEDHNYYSIRSKQRGLVSATGPLSAPAPLATTQGTPSFYDSAIGRTPVRAATLTMPSPADPSDLLTLTLAETLHDRQLRAREILLMMIPLELLLCAALLMLLWHGVRIGLRILEPLTQRLAQHGSDLTPITDRDVAIEILPLTRTIDALFAKLRALMDSQERFISDAAHQLRTPLTGMMLHAERATDNASQQDRDASLAHIRILSKRIARTSSQLLAMARAQAASPEHAPLDHIDIGQLLRQLLAARVDAAFAAGVDLGYEGPETPLLLAADASAVQEAIDNLVDNALRYVERGGKVTVALSTPATDLACITVDDDGPGVPEAFRSRLGERFFRAPGAAADGTGLGLAIARQIVDRHDGRLAYADSPLGGLRVEMWLPLGPEP